MVTQVAVEKLGDLRQEVKRIEPTITWLGGELIEKFKGCYNLSTAQINILKAVTLIKKIGSNRLHYKGRNVVVPPELDLSNVKLARLEVVEQYEDGYLFCPIPYISLVLHGIMGGNVNYGLACKMMKEFYNLTNTKSIDLTRSILEKRGSASGVYYSKEMIELALEKIKTPENLKYGQDISSLLIYLSHTFKPSEFKLVFDIGEGFEEGKTLNFEF